MSGGRIEAGRQLERLFGVGAVGGLSDAELIERFAAVDEEAAGAAFEAIVARHGPMVLRVCRRVLRDAHAAEDAFQATFLVLARRARMLGERERLGNWLYGVALRTSRKARVAAARRSARDRVAAVRRSEAVADVTTDDPGDVLGRILHEEIGRLPGSYRSAVVACYLEGLTHAQAAQELRLAESTVRGRLARARKLLGHRLTRRGVAPAVGLMALDEAAEAGWSRSLASTAARLPDAIVRSLARDALHFARSAGPATSVAVASTATALADGVLSTMWFPTLKTVSLAAALAVVGLGLTAASAGARGRPAAEASAAPGLTPAPEPASHLPEQEGREAAKQESPISLALDLAKHVPGTTIRMMPVAKDCMILSYLLEWDHGNVDNLGLANNGGGVRVLVEWPEIAAEEVADDRRFLLALYSRKTTSSRPPGSIVACEIVEEWKERTSWKHKPVYDPEPFATYKFEPGGGWKVFDVTPLVRDQVKAGRKSHGIMLRFLSEDFNAQGTWSGYDFASREAGGDNVVHHPILLIVKDWRPGRSGAK